MARDTLQYDKMVEGALRSVVRDSLAYAAKNGLPGNHHFYLSFNTGYPGVEISEGLRAQYPSDMTIVLQHQFWGLEAAEDHFVVNLSFSNVPERLKIPYAALLSFVDPSVKFGLQFQPPEASAEPAIKPVAVPKTSEAKPLAAVPAKSADEKAEAGKSDAKTDEPPAASSKPDVASEPEKDGADGAKDGDAPGKVVSLDAFRKK